MFYDVFPDSKEITIDKNTTYGLFAKTNDVIDTTIYVKKGIEFNLLTITTCTEGKTTILFFKNLPSNKVCAINKFAEDPELTNVDDFDPKK